MEIKIKSQHVFGEGFHISCDDVEKHGRSLDCIVIKKDDVQIWINERGGGITVINAFKVGEKDNVNA